MKLLCSWVWARTPVVFLAPQKLLYYSWGSRQHHHEEVTLHCCPPTLPPSHTPFQWLWNNACSQWILIKEYEQSWDDVRHHFVTLFTPPENIWAIKHFTWNIHAMLMVPTLQALHSAILSPTFSGKQEQWSSVFWTRFIPEELHSSCLGKQVNWKSFKHLVKWCLIYRIYS